MRQRGKRANAHGKRIEGSFGSQGMDVGFAEAPAAHPNQGGRRSEDGRSPSWDFIFEQRVPHQSAWSITVISVMNPAAGGDCRWDDDWWDRKPRQSRQGFAYENLAQIAVGSRSKTRDCRQYRRTWRADNVRIRVDPKEIRRDPSAFNRQRPMLRPVRPTWPSQNRRWGCCGNSHAATPSRSQASPRSLHAASPNSSASRGKSDRCG